MHIKKRLHNNNLAVYLIQATAAGCAVVFGLELFLWQARIQTQLILSGLQMQVGKETTRDGDKGLLQEYAWVAKLQKEIKDKKNVALFPVSSSKSALDSYKKPISSPQDQWLTPFECWVRRG